MMLNDLYDIDVEKVATPIWESLINASNARDYTLFSRNFSSQMLASATREAIEEQWHEQPVLTRLSLDAEYMGCLKTASGMRLLWKQKVLDNDDEFLGQLELIIENGQVKVNGAVVN